MLQPIPDTLLDSFKTLPENTTPLFIAEHLTNIFKNAREIPLTFNEHISNLQRGIPTRDCRFLVFILSKILQKRGIAFQWIIKFRETGEIHPKLLLPSSSEGYTYLHFKKDSENRLIPKTHIISEDELNEYSILPFSPELNRNFLDLLHKIRSLIPLGEGLRIEERAKKLDSMSRKRIIELLLELESEYPQVVNLPFYGAWKNIIEQQEN